MKTLEEQQNDFEEYERIFSRPYKSDPKAIMSLEVREREQSSFEIVLTLWDGTVTTATVPGCVSGDDESFIFYYTNKVVSPSLIDKDPLQQMSKIDDILSDLLKKAVHVFEKSSLKKLAGNVSWAVSVAVCKAGARCKNISIYKYIEDVDYNPKRAKHHSNDSDSESESEDMDFRKEDYQGLSPAFNISNGILDFEEKLTKQLQHLVIISNEPNPFHRRIQMVRKIFQDLKKCYGQDAIDKSVEESYTPSFIGIKNCLASLTTIIEKLGYQEEVSIGVNVGVSKFGEDDTIYPLNFKNEIASGDELVDFYEELEVALIEDPFHVNDMEFSSKLTSEARFYALVVLENDGIFADSKSFRSANYADVCNAQLLKVDQLGTVKNCIEAVSRCKAARWGTIMCSHYSCETSDSFLADLCVGLKLDQLKIGISCITSPCQTCKRVAEIEMEKTKEACKSMPENLVSEYNYMKSRGEVDVPEHKRQVFAEVRGMTYEEFTEMCIEERLAKYNFGEMWSD